MIWSENKLAAVFWTFWYSSGLRSEEKIPPNLWTTELWTFWYPGGSRREEKFTPKLWTAGFWTFWYPNESRSGSVFLLLRHFFGIFIYVLAITSVTGLLEKSIFISD